MKKYLFVLSLILLIGVILTTAQTIEISKSSPRTVINVVKRVDQEYYLLTKDQPVEFTVSGPTMIRVYSRLLWHDNMTGKQSYKFIVAEQGIEKISSFETEKSNSAFGSKKETFGKWRSFYLNVLTGNVNYRLSLLEAKSDTVAIRFSFEKPKEYKKVVPLIQSREFQLVENEKMTTYYELKPNEPIKVKVQGPIELKAVCRLNYDYTLEGSQNYTIFAMVSGKEWQSKTFKTQKSGSTYKNIPELIPSTLSNYFLKVPPGSYQIEFNLKGTLAKSVVISLYSKILEFYE